MDSLRYWVEQMHVDGFRFDLASILARDSSGNPMPNPPVLWDIESDPALAGTLLLAEAWDAAGLYQVGSFIGHAWKEWNGRFRDDVRNFFRRFGFRDGCRRPHHPAPLPPLDGHNAMRSGEGLPSQLLARVKPKVEAIALPAGYRLEWGGELESSRDAQRGLSGALPICVLLMIATVICLFNGVREPLII